MESDNKFHDSLPLRNVVCGSHLRRESYSGHLVLAQAFLQSFATVISTLAKVLRLSGATVQRTCVNIRWEACRGA